VIPTVPQDVFISLSTGQLFALTAAHDIRSGDAARDRRAFLRAAGFAAFVWWPIGVYLMVAYPAWSWMYAVDPVAHPWLGYVATLAYPAAGLGGYALGRALVRARREAWLAFGIVAANVGLGALVIVPWRRFARVGTYAEWTAGGGVPLLADARWLRDMAVIGVVFGAAAAAVVLYNLRDRLRGARPRAGRGEVA
jgi:hypothetical protein